jgi:hypothetical protein
MIEETLPPVEEVPLVEEAPTVEEENNPDLPSEDLQKCLKDLLRICEIEDESVYWQMVQKWTRLEYYFNNIVALFWDANFAGGAGGWTEPNWDEIEEAGDIPPRIVAIYRAHAEAIIAALSINVPSVVFFPDDAEDPIDIETADTHSHIAALIQKHTKAPLLFMRALTILFNHGTVLAYNYYKTSPKFGIKKKPKYQTVTVEEYNNVCSVCGVELGATPEPLLEEMECPNCVNIMIPESVLNSCFCIGSINNRDPSG